MRRCADIPSVVGGDSRVMVVIIGIRVMVGIGW